MEAQPRSKNGQPPHSTTGVASNSSTQTCTRGVSNFCTGCPGSIPTISNNRIGAVRMALHQSRRVIAINSGLVSSSTVTVRGSSAMPQMGHAPGLSRTISGCMGQTNSVFAASAAISRGSSAIPHSGQDPGACFGWRTVSRTSGCIGHVYSTLLSTWSAAGSLTLRGGAAAGLFLVICAVATGIASGTGRWR